MKKLIIYNKNSLYYSKNYSIIIQKKKFMTPEEQIEIIDKQIEMALNCLKRPNALWEVQIILINMAFVINKKINLGDNVTTISKNFTSFVKNYIEKINKNERQEP